MADEDGDDDMEETVSGMKFKGRWEEVANKGEEVAEALEEEGDERAVEEWEEMRPREHEDYEGENKERAVEKASVDTNRVEDEGRGPGEEAEKAVENAGEAIKSAKKGDPSNASREGKKAFGRFGASVETVLRKTFRFVETVIYRNIMLRTNPHYMDGEKVSAAIEKKESGEEDVYEMQVDVNDDDMRDDVVERVKEDE